MSSAGIASRRALVSESSMRLGAKNMSEDGMGRCTSFIPTENKM